MDRSVDRLAMLWQSTILEFYRSAGAKPQYNEAMWLDLDPCETIGKEPYESSIQQTLQGYLKPGNALWMNKHHAIFSNM